MIVSDLNELRFIETDVRGAVIIESLVMEDERGSFARTFDIECFLTAGIELKPVQGGVSYNRKRGTLRGLHFQSGLAAEPKLVRCSRGRVFDVVVDLRLGSPTFKKWAAIELSADQPRQLFIPPGCAHGFLTLEDDTDVTYIMGSFYTPSASHGYRWNDPAFGIAWPFSPIVIANRDATFPSFDR